MSRYLNEEGLQVVANNVKEAKEVAAGALALAEQVSETSTIAFTGTFAEWNALSAAEKAKFAGHIVNITDDSSDTVNAVRNPDWSRAVDLKTYTFSTTPYTVPEDGIFVVCRLRPITPDVISTMSVNNKSFISVKGGGTTTAETNSNTCIPVAQGDIISIDNPREQDQIWFVPYKTEVVVTEPMNYSTEEQFTGKFWIDGKKIYRRTYSGPFSSVIPSTTGRQQQLLDITNWNIDECISSYGSYGLIVNSSNTLTQYQFGASGMTGSKELQFSSSVMCNKIRNTANIVISCDDEFTVDVNNNVTITLEYTKSN